MEKDDAPHPDRVCAANDNEPAESVDAALTRIAEAIGRHIARAHIRARDAANDNGAGTKDPRPPRR